MKRKLPSLLLALAVLLSLLTACEVRLDLEDRQPQIHVDLEDPSDRNIHIQLGDQGPDFSLDLGNLFPQYQQDSAESILKIPSYSGLPYIAINDNRPYFTEEEITDESFEFYSELDSLGRCGVTMASIGKDLMPTEMRESIREVKPTGWHSIQYDWVDGKSLYNRCHLIGFQLAGENANEKNLITGTRSMNIKGMLPFENMVADYVKETGNHVMYRVTPIFQGDNLVADGVLMEGLSVEDRGLGVTFCIYAYNAEPGVTIDYRSGDNWATPESQSYDEEEVYILNTGSKKFHKLYCAGAEGISKENKEVFRGSREDLIKRGYSPCGGCNP